MSSPPAVAVFGSSQTISGTPGWVDARRVGARLARADIAVITGGYGGIMEAASRGAAEAGGHVIGVTVPDIFPGRSTPNPYVIELIEAATLTDRIGIMIERATGTIALPGSIGTATELLISWNTNHIIRCNGGTRLPCVAVGDDWKAVAQSLVDLVDAVATDIHLVDTSDQAVDWMLEQLENR